MVIIILLILLMMIPICIALGIMGIAVDSAFDLLIMAVKYLFPGIALGIIFAYNRAEDFRHGLLQVVLFAVCNFFLALAVFGLFPEPTAPQSDEIAKTVLFTQEYEDGKPVEDTRKEFATLPKEADIDYFLNKFNYLECNRTVKEFLMLPETTKGVGVQFLDEDGDVLQEICVLEDNAITVTGGSRLRYYSVDEDEGWITKDTIRELQTKYQESQVDAVWGVFYNTLKDSVKLKDGSVHFDIPKEVPGEYKLTTELYAGYVEEGTGEKKGYTVKVEWDHETKQDWVPGGHYSFALGDRQYMNIDLYLAVEGKTYHIDVLDKLPQEYKFKRWANKLK